MLTQFILALTLGSAGVAAAEVAPDSTRTQLNVAKNVAERLRQRLVDPGTNADDRAGIKRRLDVVTAQVDELSRRLGDAGTTTDRTTARPASGGPGHARSTSPSSPAPKAPEPHYYVWKGVVDRRLQWVHVIAEADGRTTIADAASATLQKNDTIRTVDSRTVLKGTLDHEYEDVLLTKGVFGPKRLAVTVLDLVGDWAIIAEGWEWIKLDTVRTVRAQDLERTAAADRAFECHLDLLSDQGKR